ncbi:DUF5365 family protein [Heyndrickxia acidicola]|uniref:DUF5365 family protein n=1 Tax=Heyndrickxia acidicola TaxID=209389 RepID=A0ABU6ME96_9BACI|nr:DUF5365 family protein [Heyndrickxia acidicola]MED1202356.1 DUF5365 family protein [Heyndrickxia acidicola]
MKILYASTDEQQQKIIELMEYMYTEIFPQFYSGEEIANFRDLNILCPSSCRFDYFSTLKGSYRVIASLQTIITILELRIFKKDAVDYEVLFNRNRAILEEYDITFPFCYSQFEMSVRSLHSAFSMFKKPANELLI